VSGTSDERRVYERYDKEIEAEYKLMSDSADLMTMTYERTKTKNISFGGVCLEVKNKISEGSVIRLGIPPGGETAKINTFCEVEWCSPANGRYTAGLSFISLTEEDIKYILGFAQN